MPRPGAVPIFTPTRSRIGISLLALSILTLALLIGRTALFANQRDALIMAITADLLLTMPVAWYLLMVRPGHFKGHSILPVIILGVIALNLIVPEAREMRGLVWVFVALEPILIGLVIRRLWLFGRKVEGFGALPLPERLNQAMGSIIGNDTLASMVAMELAVVAYALGFVRRPPVLRPGQAHFTHHRRSGTRTALGALVFIGLIEAAVVHLLLVHWNEGVAWVLTVLSAYGVLWLVGYMRSLSLLPTEVGLESISLRNGLLQTACVNRADVRGLREYSAEATKDPDYKALTPPLTPPTHLLELDRPVEVRGIFGKRSRALVVGLALDDPEGFGKALGGRNTESG